MDILEFYRMVEETKEDKSKKEFKLFLLEQRQKRVITPKEFEYCLMYLNSCSFRNAKYFDEITKNFDFSSQNSKNILKEISEITKSHDRDNILLQMKQEREKVISFNEERQLALKKIFNLIYDYNLHQLGVFGFAGTGKTTLMMELVRFLILHKLIKSVAFTAPTHKALQVMKSNFDKLIPCLLESVNLQKQGSLELALIELKTRGIQIEFMTIHKMLGFSMEITVRGERVFIKKPSKGKSGGVNICNYDLIIIDECSMISCQMLIELFSGIKGQTRGLLDYSKVPKVIFTGDPAQLPPVNEISSSVFVRTKEELPLTEYTKYITPTGLTTKEMIEIDYNKFMNELINLDSITLRQIFRNTHSHVLDLCFNIRQWVNNEIDKPTIRKYSGDGVCLHSKNNKKKIETEWFQTCIKMFQNGDTSNIILTWTNSASDLYNDAMRKHLLKKEVIDKYEVGDILILRDFYCFQETEEDDESSRFYTSEQIKIKNIETANVEVHAFQDTITKSLKLMSDAPDIVKRCKTTIDIINKNTKRRYQVWKMKVVRLPDKDSSKENTMIVIHEKSEQTLEDDCNFINREIQKLVYYYQMNHSGKMKTLEKNVINPMWKFWHQNFVSPFADVVYGYSITTHKAQGSTFNNVFVDVEDILHNPNKSEAKRCIYTSHTRCANELHLLL